MIAFDSNILIYLFPPFNEFREAAQNVFKRIDRQGGICSTLVITEAAHPSLKDEAHLIPLSSLSIKVVPLSTDVALRAGQIKLEYSLSNNDAIHLATALESGAKEFFTNDKRILKTKVPGLKIRGL